MWMTVQAVRFALSILNDVQLAVVEVVVVDDETTALIQLPHLTAADVFDA